MKNDYDIYSVFEKQNKYKSPVEIKQYDVEKDIAKRVEDKIHEEIVQRFGVFIDKDELVKALSYDREQYKKGWIDGFKEALEKPKPRTNFDRITESVESLAEWLEENIVCEYCPCFGNWCKSTPEMTCEQTIKEWLQKEIEE